MYWLCLIGWQPAYPALPLQWSGFYGDSTDSLVTGSQPGRRGEGPNWSVETSQCMWQTYYKTTSIHTPIYSLIVCACAPYPIRISTQGSHHQYEQWLLEQGESSTDHWLHACQCPKVIGWIPRVGGEIEIFTPLMYGHASTIHSVC